MNALIESHRTELEQLSRRLGVQRLDLFSSVVRSDFDADRGDPDFQVALDATPPSLVPTPISS